MPLINEVVQAEDGVLIDSFGAGLDWVACGDLAREAPAMAPALATLLQKYNDEYPDAELRLEITGDRARVVGAQEYVAANAAQKTVRDIATALCGERLRESELVAFAYSETSLEYDHVELIWGLITQLPSLLAMASGTVMVLSCEGQIKPGIHCSGDPSLLARVTADGIAWRHPWTRSALSLQTVARQRADAMPLFVLFLGAGASVGFGLPSGDKLRNDVLSRLMDRPVDESTFDAVAHDWWKSLLDAEQLTDLEKSLGEDSFVETLTLEMVLEHEQQEESQRFSSSLAQFAEQHDRIVSAIRADPPVDDPLSQLVALRQRLVLVTVNFDQVIEARCKSDDIQTFATEEELGRFPQALEEYLAVGGPVPLLKMHGDIGKPDTIVANISRTSAGLNDARFAAIQSLIAAMQRNQFRPWWYVGYSMRDRDLDPVWKDPTFYKFQERWVSPFADPNVVAFIRASRLQGWSDQQLPVNDPGDRIITWTADDFFRQLHSTVGKKWSTAGAIGSTGTSTP
ncbi:SIR2 family protein [Microbacterium sp. A1-JK]|uniref:SIR2 family protein n=1 Tax=Microbacterium sp. A1-JK TaxID=3177516 RepID=UPI003884B138